MRSLRLPAVFDWRRNDKRLNLSFSVQVMWFHVPSFTWFLRELWKENSKHRLLPPEEQNGEKGGNQNIFHPFPDVRSFSPTQAPPNATTVNWFFYWHVEKAQVHLIHIVHMECSCYTKWHQHIHKSPFPAESKTEGRFWHFLQDFPKRKVADSWEKNQTWICCNGLENTFPASQGLEDQENWEKGGWTSNAKQVQHLCWRLFGPSYLAIQRFGVDSEDNSKFPSANPREGAFALKKKAGPALEEKGHGEAEGAIGPDQVGLPPLWVE